MEVLPYLILLLHIGIFEAKRDFTIDIAHINITSTSNDYVKLTNCKLYDTKTVDVDFTFKKDVPKFDIAINLYLITKNSKPTKLVNLKMNGCTSLQEGLKSNLLKDVYAEIKRVSNLPSKCPLLAETLYYVKNFTLKDDYFPTVIPIAQWKIETDFSIDSVVMASLYIDGRIRKL